MFKTKVGLSGHFTFRVHGGRRGAKTLAKTKNLILDNGLNMILGFGANNPWGVFNGIFVGAGTTPADIGQTSMVNLVASQTTNVGWGHGWVAASGGEAAYGLSRLSKQFGQGAAAGNLSEVGVGRSATDLFSRALIVDGGGNPTTITVLPDEYLTVVYELRRYPPANSSSVVAALIDGVPIDITVSASPGALTATRWGSAAAQGFNLSQIGWAGQPYVTGSFKRRMRLTQSTATGNGTVSGVQYSNTADGNTAFIGGSMTYSFSPTFEKTSEFTLTFEVEVSVYRA